MQKRILKYKKRQSCYVSCCLFLLLGCSELETKWIRRFDTLGPGNYRINSIVSSKDDIYFTGTYTEQNSTSQCFIARYHADGTPAWHTIYEMPENTRAQGKMLLVLRTQEELLTTRNDIYVLIETHHESGLKETILAKYDTLGNLGWLKTVTTNEGPMTSALLSDSEANLYVAGWEENTGGKPTIFIAKYNESGEIIWSTKYYNEKLDFADLRFDIMEPELLVLAGLLRNTGELFYMKYDGSGQFLGFVKYETEKQIKNLSGLKIDPAANIYLSATIRNQDTGDDFLTIAYNKNDSLLWAKEYDGGTHVNDIGKTIAVDESLNVYVVCSCENAQRVPNITSIKYDKTGSLIWTQSKTQNKAAYPLMVEPRYLRLGRRPYLRYLYIAGTAGDEALILRCNTNGVYSFQARYGERGKVTVPTALSERYMAFVRTTEKKSDAFIAKYGPSTILGIARWD